MRNYYRQRAPVYDRVYAYPERQDDLRFLEEHIPGQLEGLSVIEVAAGTGYWTQFIAPACERILATDVTEEALAQAQRRPGLQDLDFRVIDAFQLGSIEEKFSAAFAGLWISHVPVQQRREFFGALHQCLRPGARVLLLDNSRAQCERLPISYTDEFGNTFQDRELDDGTVHRVLKNFPTECELLSILGEEAANHSYLGLDNFWLLQYRYTGLDS
jgi:demethylmenaquinone methyltransferase/2-methoxy-6-polyprenyl-1,4-benzoquinol methylase